MNDTIEQTFFKVLEKKLQERIKVKTDFIVQGASDDFANYRERVGELNELKAILQEFEQTLKAFSPY